MSASPLKKFLLRPVVLSGAVFCCLTLPLGVLGSEPVNIQLHEEPLFHGKLRDIAAPYLALATVLSVGAAVSSVALTGWRQSSQKSAELEEQLTTVQQTLKETETQLEHLKVTEVQLQASGLDVFLEENEVPLHQQATALGTTAIPQGEPQPISHQEPVFAAYHEAIASSVQVPELITTAAHSATPQPVVSEREPVLPATSEVVCASAALASEAATQPMNEISEISVASLIAQAQSEPLKQIKELQGQFHQVIAQIETLQQAIVSRPESIAPEPEIPTHYNYSRNRLERQRSVLERTQVTTADFRPTSNQLPRRRPTPKAQRQQTLAS